LPAEYGENTAHRALLCGICVLHCFPMIRPDTAPAVFDAHTDVDALRQYLQQHPDTLVVACYCAAWCKTCAAYRRDFDALAQRLAQAVFVWIDIEESPHLLGDAEIENFPTLLLQRGPCFSACSSRLSTIWKG